MLILGRQRDLVPYLSVRKLRVFVHCCSGGAQQGDGWAGQRCPPCPGGHRGGAYHFWVSCISPNATVKHLHPDSVSRCSDNMAQRCTVSHLQLLEAMHDRRAGKGLQQSPSLHVRDNELSASLHKNLHHGRKLARAGMRQS